MRLRSKSAKQSDSRTTIRTKTHREPFTILRSRCTNQVSQSTALGRSRTRRLQAESWPHLAPPPTLDPTATSRKASPSIWCAPASRSSASPEQSETVTWLVKEQSTKPTNSSRPAIILVLPCKHSSGQVRLLNPESGSPKRIETKTRACSRTTWQPNL